MSRDNQTAATMRPQRGTLYAKPLNIKHSSCQHSAPSVCSALFFYAVHTRSNSHAKQPCSRHSSDHLHFHLVGVVERPSIVHSESVHKAHRSLTI